MDEYKISLGVDVDTSDIRTQINNGAKNLNPIPIKVEIENIKEIQSQLQNLGGTKGKVDIPINTASLEKSLGEVADIVKNIKSSIGTLDSGKGMKSLLSSINQITVALDKAERQFIDLNRSMDALAKKDFSLNFNLKTGNANPVKAMTDYGREARNRTIPQLQEQASALRDLLGGTVQADKALEKYLVKVHKFNGISIKNNLMEDMSDTGSLSKQMDALERYINYLKKIASTKGINLDSFNAEFSKSANELVDDTLKIQSGAKQAEEELDKVGEKLKQVFGGGLDTEGLSKVLEPIISDLSEIKRTLGELSSNFSIDKITKSFKEMSDAVEQLTTNAKLLKDVLDVGISGASGNNIVNAANQIKQQTGKLISDSAQNAIKNVSSTRINKYFKVDQSDSNAFRREMDNLVRQWTNGKGNLVDLKVSTRTSYDKDVQENVERLHQAQVTYNNALGETIKKTIAWRQIGTTTDENGKERAIRGFVEVASQYSKSIDKTKAKTNNFVNQQKQVVSNLTNQINQLNKAANDQNAPKAIKDTSHLNELSSKYNDIIVAIQRMGNASSDVFIDEKINVEKLISEYKILVREFKNAESVATSLRSKDIDTVKNTYNSKLDVLISKMRKDGVYTSGFEKGAENLRSVLSNATDASGLTSFLNGLDKLEAGYKRASASAKEFNQTQKVGINVSGLQSKIADIQRISPEIDKFETSINGAKVSVKSLLNDLSQVKTQGDFSVVNSKFKAFTDAAKAAGIAITETATKIKSVNEIKIKLSDTGFDGFEQELQRAHVEAEKLENSTVDLENALRRLDVAMEAINTADEANDVKALVSANEEYENALKQVYSQLKLNQQVQNADNNLISLNQARDNLSLDIDNWLKENSAAAKNFGGRLREIQNYVHDADRTKLTRLRAEFTNIKKEAQLAGKTTQTFADKLKTQFARYSSYLSVASVFMYVEQGLRDMFKQVVAIDTAMTELKKVTDETDASYNKFLTNAASKSKELGTTIDGLITSTADFARLGYGFEDSQKLAEVANIYAVVGDEIEGVEDATQSLVSTLAAFKDEMGTMNDSDFAMSIVDKMNEVSNNFAISSGGIGQALQRSASSMAAANNSLDETIAMITAANTVAQNPEKVGNAFKTMSMRIRGAKTQLEEMGESTEGMAESTASLRQEMLALSGVDIMLDKNTFKSTYQIMDELSNKWEDLSDIAQASIIELVAGKCLPEYTEMYIKNIFNCR